MFDNIYSRKKYPYAIEVIENTWIPLKKNFNLAAKVWLPEKSLRPVPAILEYLPYRKRDKTALRDSLNHPYFAGHGYACLRVDIRGSGDSDGILSDEYLEEELEDGLQVLKWIANQDWCDGNIGIIGKSWGGFNGLQIAAKDPPELKAVISLCSTDDRYADDIHYKGGCLLCDNLSWASIMFAFNSSPPDPEIVGERWREMWFERMEKSGLWIEKWLNHQRRDEYWQHGSICENYADVKTPVMAVSGWADGYTNTVFRLLENLQGPKLGLTGPWGHNYPHIGMPGPRIGFLQECLRFWDYWLKGKETGIMQEPQLRAWMQESIPPFTSYEEHPGRWVGEDSWPSERIRKRKFYFSERKELLENPTSSTEKVTIRSPLSVGLYAGRWCSFSATPDLPYDQREEDGGALLFDSAEIEEQIEILGAPEVEVSFSSDKPVAMVAIRLSDINPNDEVTRVTYGLLNLSHINGHNRPEKLIPGKIYSVNVLLNNIAWSFPVGHKIRVAISTSYWPIAWPPPGPVRLSFYPKDCVLSLPVRPKNSSRDQDIQFSAPEISPPLDIREVRSRDYEWVVTRDLAQDYSSLDIKKDEGTVLFKDINLKVLRDTRERYSYKKNDFSSPQGDVYWKRNFERGKWSVTAIGRTILTCDEENFFVHATLDAYESERRVFSKDWNLAIPRDHM